MRLCIATDIEFIDCCYIGPRWMRLWMGWPIISASSLFKFSIGHYKSKNCLNKAITNYGFK